MARQYKQDVWQIAGPACGQYGIILVSDAIWIKPYAPPCVLLTKGIDAQQLPIKITDSMKARLLTIAACAMMADGNDALALWARGRRRDVLPRRPRAAMPGGRLPMPPQVVLRHALYILRRRAGHHLARRARRQVEEARHNQLNIRRQTPHPAGPLPPRRAVLPAELPPV